MGDKPLTPEQICFAAKNHRLIYRYLKRRQLSKDEYYDIAVFGYLKAVRDYLTKEDLQQYSFSTICWRYMAREVSNYHIGLQAQKRAANVVCMHSGYELPVEYRNPYGYDEMTKMESRLLLHTLALHIPKAEMQVVSLYCAGYSLREITRITNLRIKKVRQILLYAYDTLKQLCYVNVKEESTNEPGQTNRNDKRKPCTPHSDRAQGDHCP